MLLLKQGTVQDVTGLAAETTVYPIARAMTVLVHESVPTPSANFSRTTLYLVHRDAASGAYQVQAANIKGDETGIQLSFRADGQAEVRVPNFGEGSEAYYMFQVLGDVK